jgi:hypothetical protein
VDFLHQFFDRGVPKKDMAPGWLVFRRFGLGVTRPMALRSGYDTVTCEHRTQNSLALIRGG